MKTLDLYLENILYVTKKKSIMQGLYSDILWYKLTVIGVYFCSATILVVYITPYFVFLIIFQQLINIKCIKATCNQCFICIFITCVSITRKSHCFVRFSYVIYLVVVVTLVTLPSFCSKEKIFWMLYNNITICWT